MTIFGYAFFVGLALCLIALAGLHGYRSGYHYGLKEGDQQGYKRGRIDADNCWIAQDIEIEAARQKLWQEES